MQLGFRTDPQKHPAASFQKGHGRSGLCDRKRKQKMPRRSATTQRVDKIPFNDRPMWIFRTRLHVFSARAGFTWHNFCIFAS
ncbi:hypothetical protein HMPREF9141_1112 [Prevotella multiformis DSM 16608]|uniref:Uncharacterized protein n=1 Tax=Prevotella multiformis DSM 16608 TaxID=888743 RepID=F0F6R9_9BACT|nr:hypothetical protein HMPREF9141_1112 [Prevotella multiformis DSM 16608]